jgi:hypothetical protein
MVFSSIKFVATFVTMRVNNWEGERQQLQQQQHNSDLTHQDLERERAGGGAVFVL